MRRIMGVAAVALAAILLAGCASAPQTDPGLPAADGTSASPIGMVGLWRVTGAAGQNDHTWLRLTGREVTLWDKCGVLTGSWTTGDHRLLFGFSGGMGQSPCDYDAGPPAPAWIQRATGFRADGGVDAPGWLLTDASGATVAHLGVDGHPPTSGDYADAYTTSPVAAVDDEKWFSEPAALPANAAPVDDLVGRWIPLARTPDSPHQPFVEFAADGTWSGSDGCNTVGGPWATGQRGQLLIVAGGSDGIGCQGSPLPFLAARSTRVGRIGDTLSFYDRAGTVLVQAKSDSSGS